MANPKSKTNITSIALGQLLTKGYNIVELMGQKSFAEVAFLILRGELPNQAEARLMEAILVSSVDHGITLPSLMAARR